MKVSKTLLSDYNREYVLAARDKMHGRDYGNVFSPRTFIFMQ